MATADLSKPADQLNIHDIKKIRKRRKKAGYSLASNAKRKVKKFDAFEVSYFLDLENVEGWDDMGWRCG
jgi:hypothetical protein